jgi:ComF family protein
MRDDRSEYCKDCRQIPRAFTRGCAAFRYREMASPVYRMKYSGRAEYADWFGMLCARRIREAFPQPAQIQALVPVPVSPGRLEKRGYNQALLIARSTGEKLGIPVLDNVLLRTKNTEKMRAIGARARRANLKSSFIVYGNDVKSKKIMLVDDVYTTGATMDACAQALLDAGAKAVYFAVLAAGEDLS